MDAFGTATSLAVNPCSCAVSRDTFAQYVAFLARRNRRGELFPYDRVEARDSLVVGSRQQDLRKVESNV